MNSDLKVTMKHRGMKDGFVEDEGTEIEDDTSEDGVVSEKDLGSKESRSEDNEGVVSGKGVFGPQTEYNVSFMFLKFVSTILNKNASVEDYSENNLPEMPPLVKLNPLLSSTLNRKACMDGNPGDVNSSKGVKGYKPLFVQRWVAGICLEKPEPARIPLWVKIFNVILEAWNIEGISRIASRIGTPIIMDKVTTSMCEKGFRRASFARVLFEVEESKGIVDSVEVWVLSDEEVKERNEAKKQASGKSNEEQRARDGWQLVPNKRGGMNTGRGGSTIRGRGGFINRGGVNVEKRCVLVKNNVKEKVSNVEEEEDIENELQGIKVNIDVACDIGIPIDDEETRKDQDFDVVFAEEYRKKELRIQKIVLKKQLAEVELFILSDLSFSDDVKSRWTYEMLEFYMARISQMEQHGNENWKIMKTGKIIEDEIGEDLSTHAEFMTQDNVFSPVDASMENAVDNDNAEFRSCIRLIGMEDLAMNGLFFTWVQKRMDLKAGIMKKLDRVMGNSKFLDLFVACHATFLPYVTSDHCHALLVLPNATVRRKRSFRFMNYLANKSMKRHLRELNMRNGNVYDKVKSLRAKLKKVQSELDKDPYNARLKEDEMTLNSAYKSVVLDEEKVLKQKTKVEWLREGDHNSAYFHNLLKGRFNKSRIISVEDNMGRTWYDEEVAQAFVDHFKSFLGTCDENFLVEDPDILFPKKMDADIALHMFRVASDDEVNAALFDINYQKASGLDEFTSRFFKASWGVVGKDVCSAVKEFFTSCKMLG
nr:hypothetical protein [Tanacetum cinerariifolium]